MDDILISSRNTHKIKELGRKFSQEFEVKDIREIFYSFEIEFIKNKNSYASKRLHYWIFKEFGMTDANSISTHTEPNTKLSIPKDDTSAREKLLYR